MLIIDKPTPPNVFNLQIEDQETFVPAFDAWKKV